VWALLGPRSRGGSERERETDRQTDRDRDRDRERERERECVCVCVCVSVRERERVCVCEREIQREREGWRDEGRESERAYRGTLLRQAYLSLKCVGGGDRIHPENARKSG